ncbi:MAG: hypothetical protein AB7O24_02295 [Kofleriaceae bacterium]
MVRRLASKAAIVGGVACAAVAVITPTFVGYAADHLDSPSLASTPLADIADVFAWMTDESHLALAMTVSPNDSGDMGFGPGIQYVFHLASSASYSAGQAGNETRLICTFATPAEATCLVDGPDGPVTVSGDPRVQLTGMDGKFRMFAGRRSDPSFGNLAGVLTAVEKVKGVSQNAAGCPQASGVTIGAMRTAVTTPPSSARPPCPAGSSDCFANANVLALVIEVDKSLVATTGKPIVAVWASTHAKP